MFVNNMKKYIFLLLFLCSCSGTMFGGKVVGPYIRHYKGKMECAYVQGWFSNIKCMCWITEPNFSPDRTFLEVPNVMCEKSFQ